MKKFYILTIASIGLFIGFFLGYYIFAQVRIRVVCKPSGRVILDTRMGLTSEITVIARNVDVSECESIDFMVAKTNPAEVIFGGGEETIEQPTPSGTPSEQSAEASETPQPSEGTGETQNETTPEAPEPPSGEETTLVLEIFDICAGDTAPGDYPEIIDCLKMKSPYYVILEKSTSDIKTSFYGGIGFSKTYSLSDSVLIFQIFVRDTRTLSEGIESIEMYGSIKPYFSMGSYSIITILQEEEDILTIQKTMKDVGVLSVPLYVNENLPTFDDWEKLSFYLKTSQNLHHVGDVWFYST